MKPHHTTRIHAVAPLMIALAAFACTRAASAGEAPQIDAVRAARVATEYLGTLGPNAPYIVSLALERPALANGRMAWIARWSKAVVAEREREVGLRVNLDGSIVRLIEGHSEARKSRRPVGSSLQ